MTDTVMVRGFRHVLELYDKATGELVDREDVFNLIPNVGIDFLAQAPFGDAAPIPQFYCGLFTANYIPTSSVTSAQIPTSMAEFVAYPNATRPSWDRAYANHTHDNAASKAIFLPSVDANVYGSFIVSSPTKGGNDGLLLSVARFSTVKALSAGLEAKLWCGLTYVASNTI